MIGYLRGGVIERRVISDTAVELILDVSGVGYRILVSPRLASRLMSAAGPDAAEEAALSIHTHVREGAITLYGFNDPDERRAFEILLSAHGVGPSLALAIVAVYSPARLVEIVAGDDVDSLTLVPGVGRKTALRLLVDLKARFGELDGAQVPGSAQSNGKPTAASEVADALAQLGWPADDVRSVVRELPAEGTTEELLRHALRELARRR